MPIALQLHVRLLIVLHALAAVALLGSSTHAAIITIGSIRHRPRARLARVYATVVASTYLLTVLLGALAYPSYRYHVRALYFDRYATWASNLFDIKENFGALGLPLACGALVLRVCADPDSDRRLLAPYSVMVLISTAIVWFATISGLTVTLERAP